MRIAATDDTLRPGPLAAATRDDHHDGSVDQSTQEDHDEAHLRRLALARELGAIACAVLAIAVGILSLYVLFGWPAVGLGAAALLGAAARQLGYVDSTSRYRD